MNLEQNPNTPLVANTLPSPPDERDYKVTSYLVGNKLLPPVLDLRPKLPPVRSQGMTSSCCAHAGCVIKEYHERKEICDKAPLFFAPAFLYNQRINAPQPGMYCRDLLEILRKKGVCPEADFPLIEAKSDTPTRIPVHAFKAALPFRVARYSAVYTIAQAKAALAEFGPLLAAYPVYNSGPSFWKKPSADAPMMGGHAVAIVGYDDTKKAFLVRNSWGLWWGEGGYCWYPYEEWGAHWELWAVEDDITTDPPKPRKWKDACFVSCFSCVGY